MTETPLWWARDPAGRAALEAVAGRPVGGVLAGVRYVMEDVERSDEEPLLVPEGPRLVPEGEEWLCPPWRKEDHDLLDHGLEFDTRDGTTFGVVWQTTDYDGVEFGEQRMLGNWLLPDATVAIWDVTRTGSW